MARSNPARLTIAHVLSSFGVGGQERVAFDLAQRQAARGHRVIAVSLAPAPHGPLAAEFEAAGVATYAVPKRDGLDATLPPRLFARFARSRVQVVHTHNPLPLIYAAAPARLVGARLIHTKHGRNPGSRGYHQLRRAAAHLAHAFVAVSEATAEQAREQRDCPASRLRVITNGIALDRFRPDAGVRHAVRAELGLPQDAWVAGTVGRVDANKNQALLVRAAAPLLADGFRVVIVGDGPQLEAVRAMVSRLPRPELVHVLGRRMDVDRLLPAFDMFVLSSDTEGLPLVLPEAMASALPVVSTAVGGIPDVVRDGDTGFLIDAGDEEALRDRLGRLWGDRALAAQMGDRARELALSAYSADVMLDRYMALYRGAAA